MKNIFGTQYPIEHLFYLTPAPFVYPTVFIVQFAQIKVVYCDVKNTVPFLYIVYAYSKPFNYQAFRLSVVVQSFPTSATRQQLKIAYSCSRLLCMD